MTGCRRNRLHANWKSAVSKKETTITKKACLPSSGGAIQSNPIQSFASPPPSTPNFQAINRKMQPSQVSAAPGQFISMKARNSGMVTVFGTLLRLLSYQASPSSKVNKARWKVQSERIKAFQAIQFALVPPARTSKLCRPSSTSAPRRDCMRNLLHPFCVASDCRSNTHPGFRHH